MNNSQESNYVKSVPNEHCLKSQQVAVNEVSEKFEKRIQQSVTILPKKMKELDKQANQLYPVWFSNIIETINPNQATVNYLNERGVNVKNLIEDYISQQVRWGNILTEAQARKYIDKLNAFTIQPEKYKHIENWSEREIFFFLDNQTIREAWRNFKKSLSDVFTTEHIPVHESYHISEIQKYDAEGNIISENPSGEFDLIATYLDIESINRDAESTFAKLRSDNSVTLDPQPYLQLMRSSFDDALKAYLKDPYINRYQEVKDFSSLSLNEYKEILKEIITSRTMTDDRSPLGYIQGEYFLDAGSTTWFINFRTVDGIFLAFNFNPFHHIIALNPHFPVGGYHQRPRIRLR